MEPHLPPTFTWRSCNGEFLANIEYKTNLCWKKYSQNRLRICLSEQNSAPHPPPPPPTHPPPPSPPSLPQTHTHTHYVEVSCLTRWPNVSTRMEPHLPPTFTWRSCNGEFLANIEYKTNLCWKKYSQNLLRICLFSSIKSVLPCQTPIPPPPQPPLTQTHTHTHYVEVSCLTRWP